MHKDKFKTSATSTEYREGWDKIFKRKRKRVCDKEQCADCQEETSNEHDTEPVHDTER